MVDLITFKTRVKIIVNNLTQTLMAQIYTAAGKMTLSPKAQETLGALVEALCVEAVENILQMVEQQEEAPGDQRDPSPSDVMKTLIHQGDNAGADQTFILVFGSAAVDFLPGGAAAAGEVPGGVTTLPHSSPDHEYAQASSPPPGPPAAEEVPAARSRGRRRRREKDAATAPSSEIHHQCSQCRMLFPSSERLSAHRRKSHPACSVCSERFTGVLKLREHERREHGLLPHACDFCPKRFNHTAHRDLHVKARHTGEKSVHCDLCGRGFSCVSALRTHRVTHFDKTFICDLCGKSFYHACHLTRHKLVHQEVRPHQCSHCGKGFTQAANLRSHHAVHAGERQLCSVCGKSFRCLKNHVISKHSHELPADQLLARDAIITCDVCGKRFPNLSQVKVHQRSHTGEKPFHCDLCGRSYRLKARLRDHRSTHSGTTPYSCSLLQDLQHGV